MENLEEVKAVQRLAYEAVVSVRQKLRAGMTEKEACAMVEKFFLDRNHKLFFHRPFAWFGDRTSFTNFKRPAPPGRGHLLPHLGKEFLATDRKLEEGMAVTLDVAPSVNGLAVDIGYSFCFGENEIVTQARKDLLKLREVILTCARERLPIKDIYRQVERQISAMGYKNCHDLYPLGVLGHRIGKLPLAKIPAVSIMGFHPQAYLYLAREMVRSATLMTEDESRPLAPGLWAVEPHIGRGSFGVKFEEILVVTESDAFWLDDDLPHVTELRSK